MKRKEIFIAIVAIAVAMALFMPGAAAFANFGTFGIIPNSENTGDMENMVETSTNSDTSDIRSDSTDSDNTKDIVIVREDTIDDFDDTGWQTLGFPPAGWAIDDLGEETGDTWKLKDGFGHSGACSAYVSYNNFYDQDEWLITPEITLPSGSPSMEFYHYWVESQYDTADNNLKISTDGGSTWTILDSWREPDSDEWFYETYDLSTYAEMNVKLAWQYVSTFGETWYIDDIDIAGVIVEGFEPGPEKTIYVDDDADPSWYNETQVKTIQEGVNNASAGDTVYVYNGMYYEHVIVDKRLNLIGESRENVIVDGSGSGNVFYVTKSNVSIDTFTITNGSNGIFLQGEFFGRIDENIVMNCDVYNNSEHGIFLEGGIMGYADKNTIMNCNAYNNNGYGIYIEVGFMGYADKNTIINCNAYNNQYGIAIGILGGDSSNSNIINCDSYNNSKDGIYLLSSPDSNITNCNVYNNNGYGIYTRSSPDSSITNCNLYNNGYGIFLVSSSDNELRGNTIYNNIYNFGIIGASIKYFRQDIDTSNTVNGKFIYYIIEQSNLTFDENDNVGYLGLISCTNITVKNLDVNGILMVDTTDSTISNIDSHDSTYGIYFWMVSNSDITDCNVYNNGYGIYTYLSPNKNITNCNVYNNGYGIYIDRSPDKNITNCDVYNNNYGVWLEISSNNKLRGNSIYNNLYNFHVHSLFYQDIDISNTVNGEPIRYLIEESNMTLDENDNFGFLGLISCTNITAKNSDVNGMVIANTTNSTISNVSSHNSVGGIYLYESPDNNIMKCDCYDNSWIGIFLMRSSNCNVTNCDSYNNSNDGIRIAGSSSNCNIINCNLYDNSEQGISLYQSMDNKIINCNVYNNDPYGICIRDCKFANNKIINCNLYNNEYGIYMEWKSSDNTITNCNLYNNEYGIYPTRASSDNLFHHNNLVNNVENAYDVCSNQWDDGSEGNYWDDYDGEDLDGDGIGDTPYNITGGSNQDKYPLMVPLDDIPPTITDVTATPEAQTTTEPVNITCTVTDNWDLVDTVKINITGPEEFTLETTMNEGSYYYEDTYVIMGVYYYFIWANDTSGNIATSDIYSFIISSDTDAPISAVAPLPTWIKNIPFTVTATAYDPTFSPGVANVTLWYRYSSDKTDWTDWTSYGTDEEEPWSWSFTGVDGYYEFYSIAVDDVGNVEYPPDDADASTGIDTVPPITTIILNGTIGNNGWYVSDVTVTLSATDDTSGVDSTWYRLDSGYWKFYTAPFTVSSEGYHIIEYRSIDMAGNTEDTKSIDFKIDTTLPVTEHEFDGVIGEVGWFVSDVMVTLNAEDATSGVNYTKYKLDSGEWITYVDPYPFVVTENGEYTLYYYSVDLAGHTEEPTNEIDFKIEHDTEPPVTTHDFDGVMGENNWFVSDVTVTLIATDNAAGVASTYYKLEDDVEWIEYTGSFYVTEDGEHTIEYYSVDRVGNEETVKGPFDFNIDQTVPTIELTWDEDDSKLVADVADETSGVAKVEFYVNGEYVGEDTTSPYEWEVTKPKRGDMGQAIVFDNAGFSATSPEIAAVSQSQSQSSSSAPVPIQILSWLFGLW